MVKVKSLETFYEWKSFKCLSSYFKEYVNVYLPPGYHDIIYTYKKKYKNKYVQKVVSRLVKFNFYELS